MREQTDVVIAGGGPAGLVLGAALRKAGARVVIAERSRYDEPRVGETVPGAVKALLEGIGFGDAFAASVHERAPALVSYWGSDEPATRDAIFDPYGDGWHLDRQLFDRMLAEAVEGRGVDVRRGVRVAGCTRREDGRWLVTLAGDIPAELDATIVVDATGRPAALARLFGATKVQADRLVAIVATGSDTNRDATTLIEAASDGWWYAATLPGERAVFTWMTDADLLQSGGAPASGRPWEDGGSAGGRRSSETWQAALETAPVTRERARSFVPDDFRLVSAATHRLDHVTGENWLAVGDAAAAWDPLSGHGVAKALESALRAAQDICSGTTGEYEQWCERHFAGYLRQKQAYYAMERRWPESLFWLRRR